MPSIIRATTTSGLQVAPDNSGSLQLQTNGTTTAVTIDTSQNVGIGTTSPSSYGKLAVSGVLGISNAGASGYAWRYFRNTSTPTAYCYDDGTNIQLTVQTAGALQLATNDTERMRIDSSGNVGIGTTSPASTFGTNVLQMYGSSATEMRFTSGNTGTSSTDGLSVGIDSSSIAYFYNRENQPTVFGTNNIERMRIDSSGRLMLGTTTTSISSLDAKYFDAADGQRLFSARGSTAAREHIIFLNPNGDVGSIDTSGTSTSYNTSSDYRLKENITPMVGALNTVAQLKPVTYTWKADGSDGQGFIAHELQAIVPDAVVGEKDAVDAEGKPIYQGIDTSFLVATLTAAIQEQQTIINDLKARIETLEIK